jgi:hypothetical protein
LSSLGGPGRTGRIGSGRTRGVSSIDVGLSRDGADARGNGAVNRTSGVATDCCCWGGGWGTSLGGIGRAGGTVPGGDHAGGGDLGRRDPGASAGLGSGYRPAVGFGGGGRGNIIGGWGSGRDLPDGRLENLIRKWPEW